MGNNDVNTAKLHEIFSSNDVYVGEKLHNKIDCCVIIAALIKSPSIGSLDFHIS